MDFHRTIADNTVQELPLSERIESLLASRKGHFLLESGHHGDLWLDLELLCLRPGPVRRIAVELAAQLSVQLSSAHQLVDY